MTVTLRLPLSLSVSLLLATASVYADPSAVTLIECQQPGLSAEFICRTESGIRQWSILSSSTLGTGLI